MMHKLFNQKFIHLSVILSFLFSSISSLNAQAGELVMPSMPRPGQMVHLSADYSPALLKGIVIHPDNALKFDFIVDRGEGQLSQSEKKIEYNKLIKFFLASLAVPDEHQWVNLSPYEKNRMIEDDFGKTEMGNALLEQDYVLKQITSTLMYPESQIGKEFWAKVYAKAAQKFGTTNIPVNTFNKVWIVPDKATLYEKGNTVYIVENHLKVMLEQDYLAMSKNDRRGRPGVGQSYGRTQGSPVRNDVNETVREVIIPALEHEVNEGKNFALLRQTYSGMLLAAWYKRALKESLLGKIYADQTKLKGVDQKDSKSNNRVYENYIAAFKKGVFNLIKEEINPVSNQVMPRKYFAGGTKGYEDFAQIVSMTEHRPDVRANVDFATVSVDPLSGLDARQVTLEFLLNARKVNSSERKQLMAELRAITKRMEAEKISIQDAARRLEVEINRFFGFNIFDNSSIYFKLNPKGDTLVWDKALPITRKDGDYRVNINLNEGKFIEQLIALVKPAEESVPANTVISIPAAPIASTVEQKPDRSFEIALKLVLTPPGRGGLSRLKISDIVKANLPQPDIDDIDLIERVSGLLKFKTEGGRSFIVFQNDDDYLNEPMFMVALAVADIVQSGNVVTISSSVESKVKEILRKLQVRLKIKEDQLNDIAQKLVQDGYLNVEGNKITGLNAWMPDQVKTDLRARIKSGDAAMTIVRSRRWILGVFTGTITMWPMAVSAQHTDNVPAKDVRKDFDFFEDLKDDGVESAREIILRKVLGVIRSRHGREVPLGYQLSDGRVVIKPTDILTFIDSDGNQAKGDLIAIEEKDGAIYLYIRDLHEDGYWLDSVTILVTRPRVGSVADAGTRNAAMTGDLSAAKQAIMTKLLQDNYPRLLMDEEDVIAFESQVQSADSFAALKNVIEFNILGGYIAAFQAAAQAAYNGKGKIDKASVSDLGGINFNAKNLDLRIKRDGAGVPLPLSEQDMAQLGQIQGFVPNIIEIRPAAVSEIFGQ